VKPDFYLVEPTNAVAWSPFLGARPIGELRAGVWRIRERWEAALGCPALGHVGRSAAEFHELDEPPPQPATPASGKGTVLLARSDFAPTGERVDLRGGTRRLTHSGETVAWLVPSGSEWTRSDDGDAEEIPGLLLNGAFDLITALERFLASDCASLAVRGGSALPPGSIVLGDAALVRMADAAIEPGVVFDVRNGPVVIERGAQVLSGTRLEGPCWIGPGARVLGGAIRASAFGPRSVVRGEVSSSVFLGYANKAHDGFVGHSVLGHWVNLGAGTTTSNLKNTYGIVRLSVAGTPLATGRQFLGSLIGDHAKTAIGTMLGTGTVIGAGANVFGPGLGKYLPPFAWGTGGGRVSEEGFLQVAGRVLPRRELEVTPERRRSLEAVYRRLVTGNGERETGNRKP
jgi:UDP-N-acetylglucosamine diphosphorylase/glucosamine-1-phosphate N-acetyltransferase